MSAVFKRNKINFKTVFEFNWPKNYFEKNQKLKKSQRRPKVDFSIIKFRIFLTAQLYNWYFPEKLAFSEIFPWFVSIIFASHKASSSRAFFYNRPEATTRRIIMIMIPECYPESRAILGNRRARILEKMRERDFLIFFTKQLPQNPEFPNSRRFSGVTPFETPLPRRWN